ncbi:transcriptional regulator [Hymenobacter psoromatis]|nr:transcriptional regulator [Hymenobacter psoromatis]
MLKSESLPLFYQHYFQGLPQPEVEQVNVFRLEEVRVPSAKLISYGRRDFYKIALNRDPHAYHFADKSLEMLEPTLVFFNPRVPYSCQPISAPSTGFYCLFREEFFRGQGSPSLLDQPLFQPGGHPVYALTADQQTAVSALFEKMLAEINSDYPLKYDLLRNYVAELIHYALKLRPADTLYQQPDAKVRLTSAFLELLERQFPIESLTRRFALRSAGDFARQLSVHVNYLNRCVRETTGTTTTAHIAERLAGEARALLRHTDWNVAEIGYSLGFDEPAHFNHFFKKQTGLAPSAVRQV